MLMSYFLSQIIYVPPLRTVFGASHKTLPLFWLIPIGFGFVILAWASARVLVIRKGVLGATVKPPTGLMMRESLLPWLSAN